MFSKLALKLREGGYYPIPVNKDKNPICTHWGEGIEIPIEDFNKCYGIAIAMGKFKNKNLIAIDFDLKYLINEEPEVFMSKVKKSLPPEILKKVFLVQRTQSGGYHWIFITDVESKNQKLAQRATTNEEKYETLISNIDKFEPKDFNKIIKSAIFDKVRVIIETRGSGGYVLIYPTNGYEKVYLNNVQHSLNENEHFILLDSLREFNTFRGVQKTKSKKRLNNNEIQSLIEWFNNSDNDFVIDLLEEYGWEVVENNNESVRLLRPGRVSSKSSALYDKNSKIFFVFTTSTVFDSEKGYMPWQVMYELFDQNFNKCIDYAKNKKENESI